MYDSDRFFASNLQFVSFSAFVIPATAIGTIDVPAVEQGKFWVVERCTLTLEFDSTAAIQLANGSFAGIYLCPPNQPPNSDTGLAGQPATAKAVASRPFVLAEAELGLTPASPTEEFTTVNFAGANTSEYVSIRTLRKVYVPSLWTLRAIANLQGNSGTVAATSKITLNLQYAQIDNC